jgi:peptidoglycan/LPS O-acetylase OafA/YrhL
MWQPEHTARLVIYGTDLRAALSVAGYFTAGALFRLLQARIRFNLGYSIIVMAALAAVWAILPAYRPIWGLLQIFVVAYSVLSFAFSERVPFQGFGKYGDFSYGLYLYAFPIQQLIMWIHPDMPAPLFAAIAFLSTLPLAVASWHLIEKRMLSLKDKFSARQEAFQRHPASI